MRQIAEFVAVLSCSLFTGAAVYISLVEHPARMQCPIHSDRDPANEQAIAEPHAGHTISRNGAATRPLGEIACREKCTQRSGTAVIPVLGDFWEAVLTWERLSDSPPLPEVSLQHY
jgi:hypothetical protein